MIDPENPPTLPSATQAELEEFLMFGISAAGKNAAVTAVGLDKFISSLPSTLNERARGEPASPLARLARWLTNECYHLPCAATGWDGGHTRETQVKMLGRLVKQAGLGCYSQRAASFLDLLDKVRSGLDLRTCTVAELQMVRGVGKKTARFFVMYSRPECHEYAILDVHILRWLSDLGYQVPESTPKSANLYRHIEKIFIREAKSRGVTPIELDRAIWTSRRVNR